MIVGRLLFFAYNWDHTSALTFTEIALSMLHGLHMDLSICGYFLALSAIILSISALNNHLILAKALIGITIILLVACSVIVCVDLELYRHWGFRMNTTPLLYVGSEAFGSIEPFVVIKVLTIFLLLVCSFAFAFIRLIFPRILYMGETNKKAAITLLIVGGLMFLPIRGSFTVAPMNTGFVFYHNSKPFANHSAVNVVWNFMYALKKAPGSDYPDNFFPKEKTNQLFSEFYKNGGTSSLVLKTRSPNIILLILESFTAGVIEKLGGEKGLTPAINQLCSEGILFTNFYASGDRTDKGLISILSGFPAQPTTSIIKLPEKTQNLPQLNRYIKSLGYHTSFIYGGDVDFANFRSYLNTSGFERLTTLDDFEDSLYTSKWGVHDEYMFNQALTELDTTREKFFKVILTLSSHEPFDVPMKPFIKGNDPESLFLNSCHYTDQCVGAFISHCKTQSWWDNTVVIITADHGHRHPGNKKLHEKERFRIPLLLIGGAVKSDSVIHTVGSQTDLANTLLGQLDKTSPNFQFSKDLFNPEAKSFAAYFFNDGYGFITPDAYLVFDNQGKRFITAEGNVDTFSDPSKAYQQKLFSIYNHIDQK